MTNSKTNTIAAFAASYNRWEFKAQMMAMTNIAKALGLTMQFSATSGFKATCYEFKTTTGRKLHAVTLQN